MGQRANYIIKENNSLKIHYTHWRANSIAADLYLGEKSFLEFVDECKINEEILQVPWIEGCVIIDKTSKHLYFWSIAFPKDTSLEDYYMSQLAKKWKGWKLQILKNEMYDVEKILNIDYISKQELPENTIPTKEEILADKVEEWETALVIIKDSIGSFVTKTGNLSIENIIGYGQDIIPLLKNKAIYELPNEGDEETYECIIIETIKKEIYINTSVIGLWERSKDLWKGYTFIMGNLGYLEILKLADIDTSNKEIPLNQVIEKFNALVEHNDDFDPFEMAEKIAKDKDDIQFNPDFFDTVKPKQSLFDRVKLNLQKLFRQNERRTTNFRG